MAEYQVASIDPGVLDELNRQKEEYVRREERQRRQYRFLHELQTLARELPSKYQQRLSSDLLVGLASSLVDGTIFQILASITDLQKFEEEELFQIRKRLVSDLAEEKRIILSRHKEDVFRCQGAAHNLARVEQKNKEELEKFEKRKQDEITKCDKSIIDRLDAKVRDQQVTLMKAGAAGFYETKDPEAIRLQMYIVDFISRLSTTDI